MESTVKQPKGDSRAEVDNEAAFRRLEALDPSLAARARTRRALEAELQESVGRVSSKKQEWAVLPSAAKLKLLVEMIDIFSTMDHEAWARDSLRAMGYETV